MKKSVVILIAIIYVASIALVSFFGLQFKIFEEIVDVESVEILNEGLKENATWGKYTTIAPDASGEWHYQIKYRVHPDNATNTAVDFNLAATPEGCATIDENGVVTFSKSGMAKVYVIATDGTNAEATVTIIAKAK